MTMDHESDTDADVRDLRDTHHAYTDDDDNDHDDDDDETLVMMMLMTMIMIIISECR